MHFAAPVGMSLCPWPWDAENWNDPVRAGDLDLCGQYFEKRLRWLWSRQIRWHGRS
jgi:hypothetical protein